MDLQTAIESHSNDLEDIARDIIWKIGDRVVHINNDFIQPTISYNYLNINTVPDYCFNNREFTKEDFDIYFQKLKVITSNTYSSIVNRQGNDLGFKIYNSINDNLFKCFKKVIKRENIEKRDCPIFGRIALYNGKKKGDKAPRVFFFVGHRAILHILFFDPYHKIYPDDMKYAE